MVFVHDVVQLLTKDMENLLLTLFRRITVVCEILQDKSFTRNFESLIKEDMRSFPLMTEYFFPPEIWTNRGLLNFSFSRR